jgi:hypothetical protein
MAMQEWLVADKKFDNNIDDDEKTMTEITKKFLSCLTELKSFQKNVLPKQQELIVKKSNLLFLAPRHVFFHPSILRPGHGHLRLQCDLHGVPEHHYFSRERTTSVNWIW